MGLLYTFPRGWQPKSSKLHQHFFFDLALKGTPSQMSDTTFWAFEYWMDIVWAPREV
jgi:hypothetical protein